jgi:hypothetical protein
VNGAERRSDNLPPPSGNLESQPKIKIREEIEDISFFVQAGANKHVIIFIPWYSGKHKKKRGPQFTPSFLFINYGI